MDLLEAFGGLLSRHCYAESLNVRFGGPRYVAGADTMRLDVKALTQPFHWRKPRRIFVCSMTDLFEERVTHDWLVAIWGVMMCAQSHTFIVLTKRAARMQAWLTKWGTGEDAYMNLLRTFANSPIRSQMDLPGNVAACLLPKRIEWPLPNVWVGVSAENQQRADERIPCLLKTPAAVRWVSYEPALGPVDFKILKHSCYAGPGHPHPDCEAEHGPKLDWIVVGGESGPGARPFDLAWARQTIAQCREAGVACFVKQLGRYPIYGAPPPLRLTDPKGGDETEWPGLELRVREWPR